MKSLKGKIFFLIVILCGCSSQSTEPETVEPEKVDPIGPAITSEDSGGKRIIKASFTQLNRKDRLETFVLNPAAAFTESLVKASPSEVRGKIDILIVVDNSGSMEEEQKNLATKVAPLLSEIEDQDWRINVIKTDRPCPTTDDLPFEADTEDLLNKFEDAIDIGTFGSGQEKAIEMTYKHIRGEHRDEKCHGASWMRQGAGFSMIILSDEDEDKTTTVGPSKFISAVEQFGFEAGFNARVFGIISKPDEPCPSAQQPAKVYTDLILRTAGISGDICADDYTDTLELISVALSDLVVSEMKLQHVPEPTSVKVTLNGQPFDPEYWRLAGDTIVFAYTFVTGDEVQVDYLTEFQRSFALKTSVLNPKVEVDSDSLPDKSFKIIKENSVAGTKHLLYIPNLPAGAKNVSVKYKEDSALVKNFSFPEYDGGNLSCTQSGKFVRPTFNPSDKTITFEPSPQDGQTVDCEFEPVNVALH